MRFSKQKPSKSPNARTKAHLPAFTSAPKKRIKLALAGGAAYGAYTAGVVLQLLLDQQIEIVEISGTSAGEKIALIVADKINAAPSYDEGRQPALNAVLDFWARTVRESATTMHTFDVIEAPWNTNAWMRLFMSASSIHSHSTMQPNLFDMWRDMFAAAPFVQQMIDMYETPWKMLETQVFGTKSGQNRSANLPIFDDLMNHQSNLSNTFDSATHAAPILGAIPDFAMSTLQMASNALASDTLRGIIGRVISSEPDPRDSDDRIFVNAASGKFIKVHINTSVERKDGTMEPRVHEGQDLTFKHSMGSSALKGFLSPSIIKGERHWDGAYTQNPNLEVLAKSKIPCDGIIVIGANRPANPHITPRMQSEIKPNELDATTGLVMHHMYDEVVLRAQAWKKGQPTWHLITHNHPPENDWTALQNTFDWHIRKLITQGQSDGMSALAAMRPALGVRPTVSQELLEEIARDGLNSTGHHVKLKMPQPWARANEPAHPHPQAA